MTASEMKTMARTFTLVTLLAACGSPEPGEGTESPGSAGTGAGAVGSGGSGDAGGPSAGTAGVGETSGGAAGGGASNSAGSAGNEATAGAPFAPVGSECAVDDDCRLVSDCCRCVAAPKGVTLDVCYASCAQTMCIADGVTGSEKVCVNGRCVLDRSCDRNQVTCDLAPPECEPGMIPSVEGSCYGPCIASTECRD
jgi:hypothetical protein